MFLILHHDKSIINVKVDRGNEIIKQFWKTNKLNLIDNSNTQNKKLYGKKKLHLNDAGKCLLANNFIKFFIDMWVTIPSDSGMSSPYQRNDKNQNKVPASSFKYLQIYRF